MTTRDTRLSLQALPGSRFLASTDRAEVLWRASWGLFAALIAIDVCARFFAPVGTVGVALWFVSYAGFIALALIAGRDVVRTMIATREPLLVITVCVYIAIVAVNLTDPRSMSAEAAHEIGCTLGLLTSQADHGFRGTCLFGYPARQFFLPALPSLLFGRSQLLLNLGGDLYFLMGVFIFAGGVIRYRRSDAHASLVAALLLTVFLHVYFWNHFILIYEQSIFPLSFALIGGGLLLYYRSGERMALPLAGLLMLYLIDSYTPSLAVYGLGIVIVVYLAIRHEIGIELAAALVGGSLIALLLSYGFRGDLNVAAGNNPTLRQDLGASLAHLIYLSQGVPVTSAVLVWPLLVSIALCLSWQLGLEGFAIGWWVVAVYLFAVVSHGYSLNSLDVRLHRAIIIFPVLITLGAVASDRFRWPRAGDILTVVVVVMLATGLKFHLDYRNSQSPAPSLDFASWMQSHTHLRGSTAHPIPMWWSPGTDQFLPAVRDVLGYFDPGLQQGVIDQSLLGSTCPGAATLDGIVVLQAGEPCAAALRTQVGQGTTHLDGYYTDAGGRSLAVFERR